MIYALPLRTTFNKSEWLIRPIGIHIAQGLVEKYHYAKSGSTWKVYAFGLFLKNEPNCWGCTWWLPAPKLSVDKFNPGGYATTLTLSRMVIHPLVPRNAASFLLSGSVKKIEREGRYSFLMTYADAWKGHVGTIYRASNWQYRGVSEPTTVWLDGDRCIVSPYRNGRKLSNIEMKSLGYVFCGRYSKHIFTLQLKTKKQPEQLFFRELEAA